MLQYLHDTLDGPPRCVIAPCVEGSPPGPLALALTCGRGVVLAAGSEAGRLRSVEAECSSDCSTLTAMTSTEGMEDPADEVRLGVPPLADVTVTAGVPAVLVELITVLPTLRVKACSE